MTEPIDYSDRIAKLRANLDIASDRAPGGRWESSPLLKKWRRNHYALTLREFKQLERLIEDEVKKLSLPKADQFTLFGGTEPHSG